MEKEYISTVVIDSESAAGEWREHAEGNQTTAVSDGQDLTDERAEFTGVHTWVS